MLLLLLRLLSVARSEIVEKDTIAVSESAFDSTNWPWLGGSVFCERQEYPALVIRF